MADGIDENLPPTLILYYADTYGYYDIYIEGIEKWAKEESICDDEVKKMLYSAKLSLEDTWKQECKMYGRKQTPCPALSKSD